MISDKEVGRELILFDIFSVRKTTYIISHNSLDVTIIIQTVVVLIFLLLYKNY